MTESTVLNWVELAVTGIEILALIIIVIAIIAATIVYLKERFFKKRVKGLYEKYRKTIAHSILLALEFLIAADVVRTIALERTIESIVVLGLLVLVRIVLSWSLLIEIENRWPWQPKLKTDSDHEED